MIAPCHIFRQQSHGRTFLVGLGHARPCSDLFGLGMQDKRIEVDHVNMTTETPRGGIGSNNVSGVEPAIPNPKR